MVNRIALVTGASSGIGYATAHAVKRAGYRVFAGARRHEDMDRLTLEGLDAIEIDVTDDASVSRAVQVVEGAGGHIDLLVNNAGYGQMGAVEEVSIDKWRRQFETNVFGLVRVTQAVLPGMRRAGGGTVVNIGSMGGEFTFPLGAAYHSTKYAVESISDALRFEIAPFGIHVTLIQPGVVDTKLASSTVASIASCPDSPYAAMIARFSRAAQASIGPNAGMLVPDQVADAIIAALGANPIPTRVKVGTMAEQMIAARRNLSDRDWDAMLAPQFGFEPKAA